MLIWSRGVGVWCAPLKPKGPLRLADPFLPPIPQRARAHPAPAAGLHTHLGSCSEPGRPGAAVQPPTSPRVTAVRLRSQLQGGGQPCRPTMGQ